MVKQLKYQNITWISLVAPNKDEVAKLGHEYGIHSLVSEELLHPSARAKVDVYDDYIYLILHFPVDKVCQPDYGDGLHEDDTYEVDFILGKDFLITAHYESIPPLEEFSKILEASSGLVNSKKDKNIHAGHLFYYIIRQLYQSLESGLDNINVNLKRAEQKIFSGQEAEMVKTLSGLNRCLLDFKWALKFHREILESLLTAGKEFYGEKFGYYLGSIMGEYEKISNMVDSNRENFSELRSTNESLLSIKTNNIMKGLTVLTAIFLPVTLIGTIFGMSGTDLNMPIIKSPEGFFVAVALMAITAVVMVVIAKAKKWI
ncbi:MAG: magnesium transporter CorA family protein [Candidatus Paceibacterota bacterium]|jgi:magnesium transporter